MCAIPFMDKSLTLTRPRLDLNFGSVEARKFLCNFRVFDRTPGTSEDCSIAVLAERVDKISVRLQMGAFYVNYTVKGADKKSVVCALASRKAFVSPERNGCVVVFDEESDKQDQGVIAKVASHLSATLRTTVLAVLNHDSDILWYQLYKGGSLIDQYNSTPDYWSAKSEPSPPEGGDAKELCGVFNCGDIAEVERILRMSWREYPDAGKRHADLSRVLNLPDFAVGYGFRAVAQGYLPEDLSAEALTPTH